METKLIDKSLRDIWTATDKSTIDVLQYKGKPPQTNYSANETIAVKQSNISQCSRPKETSSDSTSLEKENAKEVRGLFQHDFRKLEDDNVSLCSIWTPTNNDNLKNETKAFYESPLIDLETTENSAPKHRNIYTSSEDHTCGTFESLLIDLETSKNSNPKHRNVYTSSKDYTGGTNESPLIDLVSSENYNSEHRNTHTSLKDYSNHTYKGLLVNAETLQNSYLKHRNDHTLPKNNTCGNETNRNSGRNLSSDYDSDTSLDERNKETFGDFSPASNEEELTLSDIAEATAACKLNGDQTTHKTSKIPNNKPRIFEYSKTLKDVREIQETTSGTKPKTSFTKAHRQNNLQQNYSCKGGKRYSVQRNTVRKKETYKDTFSTLSHISSNSGEILSISRENLTIRKTRPLQNKFKKYSPNEQRRTRTRETFHSDVSPHQPREIATRTRETFHSKGDMSYYKTEKIIYVRGERLEFTNKKVHDDHRDKIVWKNDICDFDVINDKKNNYDTKPKRYSQTNPIINPRYKDKRLPNFGKGTNYQYKPATDNNLKFKNRNNSKRHDLKQPKCVDQGKLSKHENIPLSSEEFRNSSEDETAEIYHWQSSANKLTEFNFDKPNNVTKKTSVHENNYGKRTIDMKHDAEKHVTHFKVYDPKLHRPTKKKIPQYPEHMKFKNGSQGNAQREETGVPISPPEGSPYKDFQEQFKYSENHNLDKKDKENKTLVKDTLRDIKLNSNKCTSEISDFKEISTKSAGSNAKKHLKSPLICEAKEIADLIVGCERGLEVFKSFYHEWIELRKQSISLLEQIVLIINQSSRRSDTMKHVIAAINIAAGAANLIPHPGARVAGPVLGFFANFFNRTDNDCKKSVEAKKYEIREIFQRDIDSSSYVYIYGVQCSSQFQETCNVIGKFHKQMCEGRYQAATDDDDVLEFMKELSEYNNSNTVVFYKKLRMCYDRLIKNTNSENSRVFVKIFEDVPEAISVIELLPWKFDSDGFDNSIVQEAWDELFLLFQDGNPTTVDIIKDKVQNILHFLNKEHRILSRNVVNLFKETHFNKL